MTPRRISVGVMPTSLAVSASLVPPELCPAAALAAIAVVSATTITTAIQRNRLTCFPPWSHQVESR